MKKTIALFLVGAILLLMSACAREPELPPATGFDVQTVDESPSILPDAAQEQLDDLHAVDFGGVSFRIATDDPERIMPPNSSNLVNRKIYDRNRAVEKKYNVTITLADGSGLPTVYDRIRTEALSGSSYCELAVLKVDKIRLLTGDGALLNLRSVPYLDLSEPYYFSEAVNAATLGENTYAVAGDFTYNPYHVFVTYFNRDLIESAGLPDLYELFEKGQWDYDNFLLYCEEVYSTDRPGGWKAYGYSSPYPREILTRVLWAAGGQHYLNGGYGVRLSLGYRNSVTDDWLDFAHDILFGSPTYYFNYTASPATFSEGNLLFCIAPLSEIRTLTGEANFDWGIVPVPQHTVNQANAYSYLSDDQQMACIPAGAPDLSLSGAVTAALFAASYQSAIPDFLTQILNLYLPDEACGYAVKDAVSSPYYDSALFFGGVYTPVAAATYTLLYRAVSGSDDYEELYVRNSRQFESLMNELF